MNKYQEMFREIVERNYCLNKCGNVFCCMEKSFEERNFYN